MDNQPVNLSSKQATNHETWFTQIDRHPFSCVQPFQAWTSPDQRIRQPGAVPTVALVFGAENRGLTNVELSHAQRFLCPQGWQSMPPARSTLPPPKNGVERAGIRTGRVHSSCPNVWDFPYDTLANKHWPTSSLTR